jgi:hypothetical protein
MVYISVHFHYRSNFSKINEAKEILSALCTLYEASVYLHPLYTEAFRAEDAIIHDSRDSSDGKLLPASQVSRVARASRNKLTSALGKPPRHPDSSI